MQKESNDKIYPKMAIEYIDAILYINLNNRNDRKIHIIDEIIKIDPTLSKTHRIEAIYDTNGAIGCSLSHIKTLNVILDNPDWNICMIMEDDFTFIGDIQHINDSLYHLIKYSNDFDILLLGVGISNLELVATEDSYIKKTISSQTTSCYIVNRKYILTLLSNYVNGMNMLKKHNTLNYCIDQYWKQLIPQSNWYTLTDRIGYQYENYSDIEKRIINYKC